MSLKEFFSMMQAVNELHKRPEFFLIHRRLSIAASPQNIFARRSRLHAVNSNMIFHTNYYLKTICFSYFHDILVDIDTLNCSSNSYICHLKSYITPCLHTYCFHL